MAPVETNTAVEFHDSRLERIDIQDDTVIAVVAAYVHRSSGMPGLDSGTGWSQSLQLRFRRGRVTGSVDMLPMEILGGHLESSGEHFENLLPLPLARVGSTRLELHGWNDLEIDIEGDSVEAVLVGEARYIEDVAADREPNQ
jgi:hypothetical protein